jgi:hypothetical protein
MEKIVVIIFISLMAFWLYAHLRFRQVFKEEAPDIYKKYNKMSFLSVGGFKWIDYALSRAYRDLKNTRLTKAGDTLCNAYLGMTSINGLLVIVVEIVFVSLLAWGLIKYVT